MIPVFILDDEPENRLILRRMIRAQAPHLNIVAEAGSLAEAREKIGLYNPAILFLDIELADGLAFDLLEDTDRVDAEVIFVTAFNDYLLKAFQCSASGYVLKPLAADKLSSAIAIAEKRLGQKQSAQLAETLMHNLKQQSDMLLRIALPVFNGYEFVDVADIHRLEASGNSTYVFTTGGKKYLVLKTLGEYEKILPDSVFFRIHHGHIININQIVKYYKEGRGGYVEMTDGTTVEVAHRRKDEFLSKFGYK